MGLSTKDFIPVSMKMKAANNEGIRTLGAVVIIFAGNSGTRRLETRQIAYVTDTSDRIFLSRAACVDLHGHDLGQIPSNRGGQRGDL